MPRARKESWADRGQTTLKNGIWRLVWGAFYCICMCKHPFTKSSLSTYEILNPLTDTSDKEICPQTRIFYRLIIRGMGQRTTAVFRGIDKWRIVTEMYFSSKKLGTKETWAVISALSLPNHVALRQSNEFTLWVSVSQFLSYWVFMKLEIMQVKYPAW